MPKTVSLDLAKRLKPKNYKGGIITARGYKLIYVPMNERDKHSCKKDGYAFEHRYAMENHLSRKLKRTEAVHHVNGDKLDNQIENLMLLSIAEHMSLERKLGPVNLKAIEAMRSANKKTIKEICKINGCSGFVLARGLCNKHYHFFRKGLLQFKDNGEIVLIKIKRHQQPKTKVCMVCGKTFMAYGNNAKNCEFCRQPYLEAKRSRERRMANENSF